MMYHIKEFLKTFVYVGAVSIILLSIMAWLDEKKTGWCVVNMGNSTATMPCAELNEKVYEVTL